jgi:transcriptional regulator with XRE-family HTH domain
MSTFGKKLRECREAKGLSQKELAKLLNTSYSVIGKYERDEMLPSIEAAKKIAKLVDTTVGYLLSESEQENVLKDPDMLKRLTEIEKMEDTDKGHILSVIDGFIKSIKLKNIAAL